MKHFLALDAYCLLEIYNLFKTICQTSSIPFEEICQKIANSENPDIMKPKPKNKKHRHVWEKKDTFIHYT